MPLTSVSSSLMVSLSLSLSHVSAPHKSDMDFPVPVGLSRMQHFLASSALYSAAISSSWMS